MRRRVEALAERANDAPIRHAACFGLGPQGKDHLIVNRLSGEINRMEDDGVNYLQRLRVIPPEQLAAVQEVMNQRYRDGMSVQDFGRLGP